MAAGVGCLGDAAGTVDLSGTNCNTNYCPDCFYWTGTADVAITFEKCHEAKWGTSNALGTAPLATAARMYQFTNTMAANTVTITAGAGNAYVLKAGMSTIGICHTVADKINFIYNPNVDQGCPVGCDKVSGATNFVGIDGTAFTNQNLR